MSAHGGPTHDRKTVECPKCHGRMRRCRTGGAGCWHCTDDACDGIVPPAGTRPKRAPPTDNRIEELLSAARRHGDDDDPEHEAGDLQGLLRRAWQLLPTASRDQLLMEFDDLLTEWGGLG